MLSRYPKRSRNNQKRERRIRGRENNYRSENERVLGTGNLNLQECKCSNRTKHSRGRKRRILWEKLIRKSAWEKNVRNRLVLWEKDGVRPTKRIRNLVDWWERRKWYEQESRVIQDDERSGEGGDCQVRKEEQRGGS